MQLEDNMDMRNEYHPMLLPREVIPMFTAPAIALGFGLLYIIGLDEMLSKSRALARACHLF